MVEKVLVRSSVLGEEEVRLLSSYIGTMQLTDQIPRNFGYLQRHCWMTPIGSTITSSIEWALCHRK